MPIWWLPLLYISGIPYQSSHYECLVKSIGNPITNLQTMCDYYKIMSGNSHAESQATFFLSLSHPYSRPGMSTSNVTINMFCSYTAGLHNRLCLSFTKLIDTSMESSRNKYCHTSHQIQFWPHHTDSCISPRLMTPALSILTGRKKSTAHLLRCAALFTHGQQSQLSQTNDEMKWCGSNTQYWRLRG